VDPFSVEVPRESAGERADSFLAQLLSTMLGMGVSRERAKILLETGCVRQAERILKPATRLKQGQIEIALGEGELLVLLCASEPWQRIEPAEIPLDALFEDERLIVVNKPAGMSVHPSPGDHDATLAQALMHRWGVSALSVAESEAGAATHAPSGDAGFNNDVEDADAPEEKKSEASKRNDQIEILKSALLAQRIGIVHRIDKMTTGCVIVARDAVTLAFISEQFAERTVEKTYLAITVGVPDQPSGVIETAIMRHPRDRTRYTAVDARVHDARARGARARGAVRYARSDYEVISVSGGLALLAVRIHTGRTHQIRVHLKSIGLEILGDSLYGTGANARFLEFVRRATGSPDVKGKNRVKTGFPAEWREYYDDNAARQFAGIFRLAEPVESENDTAPAVSATAGQMLHAWKIAFTHPDGRLLSLVARPPEAMQEVCAIAGLQLDSAD